MPDEPLPDLPKEAGKPPFWKRMSLNILTLSILAHLLFIVGAAYLIVQTIQPKRQRTFQAGSQLTSATHSVERKVQQLKKRTTASAPASVKRVMTAGLSKTTLPALPSMPTTSAAIAPAMISGMGGVGTQLGAGSLGGGGGKGGGGGLNLFGVRDNRNGLVGTFYDLKQNAGGAPTGMTPERYAQTLQQFFAGGWNEGLLGTYFKGPQPLYLTQLFIPVINADAGPRSFHLEDKVQPRLWVVLYKGRISPPESGRYRFVTYGDDVLAVRVGSRTVVDGSITNLTHFKPRSFYHYDFLSNADELAAYNRVGGFAVGEWTDFNSGQMYDMQALIGEQPGGWFCQYILVEKEGATYEKDAGGRPILPVLRFGDGLPPATKPEDGPPFKKDAPPWKAPPSLFR